jgi:hypothetical protein
MDLINKDTLDKTIDLYKKIPRIDQEAVESIRGLTDEEVIFHLYSNMLLMSQYKKGIYNLKSVEKDLDSAAKSSPEGKVIKSYAEYLFKKANQSESFDKIPYLNSIKIFFNWMTEEVNFIKVK